MKNALTLIGGLFLVVGPVLVEAAPSSNLWWTGKILFAIGGFLVASRGMFETNKPTIDQSQIPTTKLDK